MIRHRLAALLRRLADRLSPREPEPEVEDYAAFLERLGAERQRERALLAKLDRIVYGDRNLRRVK